MLLKSNFQLDASDFVYVKYDVRTTTGFMLYLQQDLTSLCEIFPAFHETKFFCKHAGEIFSACVEKFLFQ